MLCLLCLDESKNYISIFHGEGIEQEVQDIIAKHFWFKAREDDPAANSLCIPCWLKLEVFHTFYLAVEKAHRNFMNQNEEKPFRYKNGKHPSLFMFGNEADSPDPVTKSEVNVYEKVEIVELNEAFELAEAVRRQDPNLEEPPPNDPIKSEENFGDQIGVAPEAIPRTRYQRAAKKDRPIPHTFKLVDIKEEILSSIEEDRNELSYTSNLKESSNENKESKERKPAEPKSKHRRPKRSLSKPQKSQSLKRTTSKEFDALIAQHMKLQCALCAVALADFKELKKHYQSEHNIQGYAVCCGKKFLKRGVLTDHIQFHLNPEYFKCPECGKLLSARWSLENHMFAHKVENKEHQCDECPKRFRTMSLLKRHKDTHLPEEQRRFICKQCGRRYSSKSMLKNHRDACHDKLYAKMCDICGKKLDGIEALRRHLLEHDGIAPPGAECEKCGVRMKHKVSLWRHMREKHPEDYSNFKRKRSK